jgi:hypothetical protein
LASASQLYPAFSNCDNVPQRRALPVARHFMQEDNMARMGLMILSLLALAACGSSDAATCDTNPSFSSDAFLTGIKSNSGSLTLSVRSAPTSPPQRGCGALQYAITDSNGNPVDGLTLDVVPWMVDMGHGSSITPIVTAQGQGEYLVTYVDLYMPGKWQLQTSVYADGASSDAGSSPSDTFGPSFQVN